MADPPKRPSRAGRLLGPRHKLPDEILERLGPPPADKPLKMARWWQRMLAELAWLDLQGRGSSELLHRMRQLAGTASKIIPPDLTYAASKALEEDQDLREADMGPEPEELDDEDDDEPRQQPRALRSHPR